MSVALTQLIPIQELEPGAVGLIRNQVIENLIAQVSRELSLPAEKLVVRDVRPLGDLTMRDASAAVSKTVEDWDYLVASAATRGYITVTGDQTMADQRYTALFGVRDMRYTSVCPTGSIAFPAEVAPCIVSLIKINVGGADKVIWDISSMQAYRDALVAFTPSAVIIPQNAAYNIYYHFPDVNVLSAKTHLVLIGVVCEPRGKVVSP